MQDCKQCGKCCEKWGWDQKGITEDLTPWFQAHRQDILQHVSVTLIDGKRARGSDLSIDDLHRIARIYYWVDASGRKIRYCPFFEKREDGKVYCKIHIVKPAVCIGFAPWAEVWHDYGLNCPACLDNIP